MRIRTTTTNLDGIVPASYVEISSHPPTPSRSTRSPSTSSSTPSAPSTAAGAIGGGKKIGPAVAPRRGAKKLHYVEALYDYDARSDMEFSMAEGDRFVLITKDAGDGWADVERGGVTKSVPANYVQDV